MTGNLRDGIHVYVIVHGNGDDIYTCVCFNLVCIYWQLFLLTYYLYTHIIHGNVYGPEASHGYQSAN